MHTLVQGLEDAAIARNVMEEYATNADLQDLLTLKKIERLIEAKESAKRSMTELTRAKEQPHVSTKKLSDYHNGKSAELQKSRDNPGSNNDPQGRSCTQPDSRVKTLMHLLKIPRTRIHLREREKGCPGYDKICNKCGRPGYFRVAG